MTIMHEIETANVPTGWETWRCTARSCPQDLLHLTRRAHGEDTWLIYERPGWVIAASAPVCPTCAATLTREPSPSHGTQVAAGAGFVP